MLHSVKSWRQALFSMGIVLGWAIHFSFNDVNSVANWVAFSSNADQLYSLAEESNTVAHPTPFIIVTGTLKADTAITEPMSQVKLNGIAELKIERQVNTGSDLHWETTDNRILLSAPKIGSIQFHPATLINNNRLKWEPYSQLENLPWQNALPARSGNIIQLDDNNRLRYWSIPDNQLITFIGSYSNSGYLDAASFMPKGYPALLAGKVTPHSYSNALYDSFVLVMKNFAYLSFFSLLCIRLSVSLPSKNKTAIRLIFPVLHILGITVFGLGFLCLGLRPIVSLVFCYVLLASLMITQYLRNTPTTLAIESPR